MKKLLFALFSVIITVSMLSFIVPQAKKPWEIPAKYKAMKNKSKGNASAIKMGKELYSRYCRSCHGNNGKGDGPRALTLKTKVSDLTTKEFKALPDGDKYYMTIVGRDEMPNFEKKIPNEDDRWAIISYLDTL